MCFYVEISTKECYDFIAHIWSGEGCRNCPIEILHSKDLMHGPTLHSEVEFTNEDMVI